MPEPFTAITFVGHATVLVERDGKRILTDPVLVNRILFLTRQVPDPDPGVYEDPDLVLVSHAHYDHLDVRSLKKVTGGAVTVVPRGCGGYAHRAGAGAVIEMDEGESADPVGVRVEAVHAEHNGMRRPLSKRLPALGYVLPGAPSIYFAGDTDLYDGLGDLKGRVDVALIPVAGWGPKVGTGHLDAERAAKAVGAIEPKVAIPIHWGTVAAPVYRVPDLREPALDFEAQVAKHSPGTRVEVLDPGETLRV